jgi:azurin
MSAFHGHSPGIALSLLALCACGGGESSPPTPAPAALEKPAEAAPAAPTPPPAQAVVAKPEADGVTRLQGNDQMRFSATRIEAPAGKIKIELKNVGALPKEAMGHNLVILKPGSDPMAFALKGVAAKATDYVIPGSPELIAQTKLLGPGESDTLELELSAGTYVFLCTFPGHVGLMNGQLVVQ